MLDYRSDSNNDLSEQRCRRLKSAINEDNWTTDLENLNNRAIISLQQ